jgi:hypothetical protein
VAAANILAMKECADEFFNIGFGVATNINELVRSCSRSPVRL